MASETSETEIRGCNSQLNDLIEEKKHSHEHEESVKSDQMASKEIDEKVRICRREWEDYCRLI